MSDFCRIDFTAIRGGATTACHRLPPSPAIYAFFAPAPTISTSSPEHFLASINELVERRASPTLYASVGSLHQVALENQSSLSDRKQESLAKAAESPDFRSLLCETIAQSVTLRAPLYVGQTGNLQRRIKEHISPGSDLAVRLRSAGISIEQCSLTYKFMPDSRFYADEDILTLVEEILTRLLRPGFVARIG